MMSKNHSQNTGFNNGDRSTQFWVEFKSNSLNRPNGTFLAKNEKRLEIAIQRSLETQKQYIIDALKNLPEFNQKGMRIIEKKNVQDSLRIILNNLPSTEEMVDDMEKFAGVVMLKAGSTTIHKFKLSQFGISFDLSNDAAVRYMRDLRALQLSQKSGSISDTTNQEIIEAVTDSLLNGETYTQVAAKIEKMGEQGVFSPARAQRIAVNEIAKAYGFGNAQPLKEYKERTGKQVWKQWVTVGDELVSDVCQKNADQGWILFDEAFSSGDMTEPSHINCRCAVAYRFDDGTGSGNEEKMIENEEIEEETKMIAIESQEVGDSTKDVEEDIEKNIVGFLKIKMKSAKDGKTPKKGVDYFTEEDVKKIVSTVRSLIPTPKDGNTPRKGIDYFTDEDIRSIVNNVLKDIPMPKDGKDAVIDYEYIIGKVLSLLPKPKNGNDGKSSYVYIAYAQDDSGRFFSEKPSANLDYIGIITVQEPIYNLSRRHFVGYWKRISNPKQNGFGLAGKGEKGDTGIGLPAGGSTGQVATKASGDDYDITWTTPSGGGGGGGSGDVVGPASAVNNNFAAFDATTGKLIKDSGSKASDFAASSHTHTASEVTDFDTEVSNNTDVAANTSARHTHANKALLDTYTQTEANIADAVSKKHTHANQAVLDATTASFTTADETKLDAIEALADVTDAANVGSSIDGSSAKTTPVDADTMPLIDSAASNVLKKVTWANIKATLKTYFDSLYALATHTHAISDTTGLQTALDNKLDDSQASAFGLSLLDDANAATAVTTLGLDNTKKSAITFGVGDGSTVITTGLKQIITVPFACTINSVTLTADQTGSIVIDIWKDTYANYPPVAGDSITASAKPTISSGVKSQDATLTGWTTSISAGDSIAFNVNSCSSITRATLTLAVTKT